MVTLKTNNADIVDVSDSKLKSIFIMEATKLISMKNNFVEEVQCANKVMLINSFSVVINIELNVESSCYNYFIFQGT